MILIQLINYENINYYYSKGKKTKGKAIIDYCLSEDELNFAIST